MGRESATYWDKGTEVPSLSQDKGIMEQTQNVAMRRDGPEQFIKLRDGKQDYFFL